MQLDPYTSKLLPKSPLVLVAAQIDFEEVAVEISHQQARAFQKHLSTDWSVLQAIPVSKTTITNEGISAGPQRQAYRISKRDDNWAIVVRSDAVTLETKDYKSWIEFKDHFSKLVETTASVLDPSQIFRLGVRFVDQFILPDEVSDWRGLVSDSLLGTSADEKFADAVLLSDSRTLLQYDERTKCLLRYGKFVDQQNKIRFLLDSDVFSESHQIYGPEQILLDLDRLHDYSGKTFRTSISDKFYSWLGEGA